MQQQVTISMQYQAWLDMIDRLEQIITKIESGTEVTDPGAVSELEQIRGILSSPLTVQDSAAQTELTAIKNALSGVLNMKASDTDAELSLIKEKLEDIETKLNGTLTTQLTGSNLAEQLTEADAVSGVLTFEEPIRILQIYNADTTNTGQFLVNGRTVHVPPNTATGIYNLVGSESAEVTVTGATAYIVSRFV